MTTPFAWIIDADTITPSQLSDILDELTSLLAEIDSELSQTGQRTLELVVQSLSYNSPAQIGLLARPRPNQPDNTGAVVAACAQGIVLVAAGQRPPSFNDEALTHLQKVGNHTGNGVRSVTMRTYLVPIEAPVNRQTSATVERILPHGYSLGSIEGRLEGLNIHGQPVFVVYDAVSERAVRCYFQQADLDRVKDAIGRSVLVSGNLRRDPTGRPQQVRPVDFFRFTDALPTPPTVEVAGLFGGIGDQFSGIGDTRTYLEMIRGE